MFFDFVRHWEGKNLPDNLRDGVSLSAEYVMGLMGDYDVQVVHGNQGIVLYLNTKGSGFKVR